MDIDKNVTTELCSSQTSNEVSDCNEISCEELNGHKIGVFDVISCTTSRIRAEAQAHRAIPKGSILEPIKELYRDWLLGVPIEQLTIRSRQCLVLLPPESKDKKSDVVSSFVQKPVIQSK